MKKYAFFVLIGMLLVNISFGCDPSPEDPEDPEIPIDSTDTDTINPGGGDTIIVPIVDSSSVYLTFKTDSITIVNPLNDEISITTSDNQVTIHSTAAGMNYVISGEASAAAVNLSSDSSFNITFNGLSLSNSGPILNIQSAVQVVVYLPDTTSNLLTNNSSSQEGIKSCIYSNGALVFAGAGTLTATSSNSHAIYSKSSVRIQSGNYTLTAGKDGIHSDDYIQIDNGQVRIFASDDGIQSEGNYVNIIAGEISIQAVGDGISADSSTTVNNTPSIYISGGILDIATTGEKGMGIKSDANISITAGTITINLSGAASKALKSIGNVRLSGGTVNITTSGDGLYDSSVSDISSAAGIKCDGNLNIEGDSTSLTIFSSGAAGKGINVTGNLIVDGGNISVTTSGTRYTYGTLYSSAKAIKTDGYIIFNGGSVKAKATGGNGSDAIDSEGAIYINGGTCEAIAYDDAIQAATTLSVTGGNVFAYSTENDGFDAKTGIYISGGLVVTVGSSNDKKGGFETDGVIKITGGTILAIGNKNKKPSTVSSTQYSASYSGSGTADTYYNIQDSEGTTLMTYLMPRAYSTLHLIYSCSDFTSRSTYSLYKGGSISGGEDFNGYVIGGTYSGGNLVKSFTISSLLTSF